MFKAAGLVLLFLASVLVGAMQYRKLDDRVRFWNAFVDFLRFAETSIRYIALPVQELLERYCRENGRLELAAVCRERLDHGELFPEAWANASKQSAKRCFLPAGDLQLLTDFGMGLGVTDVEGQVAHCRLYAASAEEIRQAAREEKRRKGKLSIMLGILLGLGIDLLLL